MTSRFDPKQQCADDFDEHIVKKRKPGFQSVISSKRLPLIVGRHSERFMHFITYHSSFKAHYRWRD
ncbi:hypothetical protein HS3_01987 [Bacillus subtilis]|nr:hypothetical protein HS3_01987 [Bacillus subtilis]